jgi:hypothetical protein
MKVAPTSTRLRPEEFKELLSPYLTEGRKQDSWRIDEIVVEEGRLEAEVSMRSTFSSPTDVGGFHLTIFSALEFASQLLIIYGHWHEGYARKSREAWMVESNIRAVRAIRDPNRMQVRMDVHSLRRRGENYYCVAELQVTDEGGGLFEIVLKGFLS